MITEKDSAYHPNDPAEWRWTETTPLIFSVPEARMGGATCEMLPTACWLEATDVRGKVHRMTGAAIAGHPYDNFNPSHIAYQCLMRWETPEGLVGHSELANIFGREYLAAHLSRHAR